MLLVTELNSTWLLQEKKKLFNDPSLLATSTETYSVKARKEMDRLVG